MTNTPAFEKLAERLQQNPADEGAIDEVIENIGNIGLMPEDQDLRDASLCLALMEGKMSTGQVERLQDASSDVFEKFFEADQGENLGDGNDNADSLLQFLSFVDGIASMEENEMGLAIGNLAEASEGIAATHAVPLLSKFLSKLEAQVNNAEGKPDNRMAIQKAGLAIKVYSNKKVNPCMHLLGETLSKNPSAPKLSQLFGQAREELAKHFNLNLPDEIKTAFLQPKQSGAVTTVLGMREC